MAEGDKNGGKWIIGSDPEFKQALAQEANLLVFQGAWLGGKMTKQVMT
jgi:hypothetical protein